MPRTVSSRNYGKRSTRTKAERLFSELPQSPVRMPNNGPEQAKDGKRAIDSLTEELALIDIAGGGATSERIRNCPRKEQQRHVEQEESFENKKGPEPSNKVQTKNESNTNNSEITEETEETMFALKQRRKSSESLGGLPPRVLTWDEVCPPGDRIVKIAEASYAEVYRVSNERGTSIIKVIRLDSPIRPQTKAQIKAGLVDEEPRSEEDIRGELQISEWLADVPGFVVYKESYMVQGKAPKALLETHQKFQKRMKRRDPDRAQFYPSPSRYLDTTKFLVVELGDAGTALEDWKVTTESQLWDIFLLEAIALARAENIAMFEHRDLHEGNLCIRQPRPPQKRHPDDEGFFGYSGLEITILDYGLSRAEDLSIDFAKPVAYDLERDLSIFTSTHAPQCRVYRHMRSFLLRADRKRLPPEAHCTPYDKGINGPVSWEAYAPHTNVLWLAYLYEYLVNNFAGSREELDSFKEKTHEMWECLDPDAALDLPIFDSAENVVGFAWEAGWVREDQLMEGASFLERETSIILSRDEYNTPTDSS